MNKEETWKALTTSIDHSCENCKHDQTFGLSPGCLICMYGEENIEHRLGNWEWNGNWPTE